MADEIEMCQVEGWDYVRPAGEAAEWARKFNEERRDQAEAARLRREELAAQYARERYDRWMESIGGNQ